MSAIVLLYFLLEGDCFAVSFLSSLILLGNKCPKLGVYLCELVPILRHDIKEWFSGIYSILGDSFNELAQNREISVVVVTHIVIMEHLIHKGR